MDNGDDAEVYRVLDLFSGAGGLSLGFEQAGFKTILAVDNDQKAVSTFNENFESKCLKLDLSKRPELPINPDDVDVVVGGPPCQGFSISGDRDESDIRNDLPFDFVYYVEKFSPEYVVMENVPGIESLGNVLDKVTDLLEEMGYIVRVEKLNAADFSVPQNRERVFVLAGKEEEIPHPSCESEEVTVGEVFEKIQSNHENHIIPRHQEQTVERIKNTNPGEALYESYTQLIRLDADELAPTIVSGGPRPAWQLAHPTEDRGLTVHERALLQTFPPNFIFKGGMISGRIQTGNAVPPKMAKAIADSILEVES